MAFPAFPRISTPSASMPGSPALTVSMTAFFNLDFNSLDPDPNPVPVYATKTPGLGLDTVSASRAEAKQGPERAKRARGKLRWRL